MRSFKPSSSEQPRSGELVVVAIPRPGAEDSEDRARAWEFDDGRMVLAVADGAGGHALGGRAAETAIDQVESHLKSFSGDDLRGPVLDAFEDANRKLMALGVGAATTLVVTIVEGMSVRTLHAGDSMGLVVGLRGGIRLQTQAHSPVGHAVEAGVLAPEDALHHDDLHVVSNMLGAPDMLVEVHTPRRMRPMDTVLLSSDGLHDNLHLEEIIDVIRRGSLTKAADQLCARSLDRMNAVEPDDPSKPDDLSFLLYRPTRRRR